MYAQLLVGTSRQRHQQFLVLYSGLLIREKVAELCHFLLCEQLFRFRDHLSLRLADKRTEIHDLFHCRRNLRRLLLADIPFPIQTKERGTPKKHSIHMI